MRGLKIAVGLGALVLLVQGLAPSVLAAPSITVLESPDVVVANPPENMTQDNFNPEYVFSAKVRVINDDTERQIHPESIVYTDPSVEGDCPRDKEAFPASFIRKPRNLEPGEAITFGGSARPQQAAQGDVYWPMAISREYRNAQTGQNVSMQEGEHTFCVSLRVSGDDPACDKPSEQTCVIATEPWRSYVRRTNQAPEITVFEVSPSNPRPGQEVLLQADATDADTEPRPDSLRFKWDIAGSEETGKTVRTTFTIQDEYTVNLTVTDGFDQVKRSIDITVQTSGNGDGGANGAPAPGVVAIVAVGWIASVLARRRQA